MQAAQQASRLGFDVLGAQRTGGAEQRAIEQQGISADLAQFTEERDYPQKQLMFMQSLLDGLPLETQTYTSYEPSGLGSLAGTLDAGNSILSLLRKAGFFAPPAGDSSQTDQQKANAQALINSLDPNFVGPDPRVG
jgi:hypothetical protein